MAPKHSSAYKSANTDAARQYKSTNTDAARAARPLRPRCSVYLLYEYKSTNTDAARQYKSTNTDAARAARPLRPRCSVYLLYEYKSTNTDAARAHAAEGLSPHTSLAARTPTHSHQPTPAVEVNGVNHIRSKCPMRPFTLTEERQARTHADV